MGHFDLYDPANLAAFRNLRQQCVDGVIGPPGTGGLFTTTFGSVTGGSLEGYIDPNSLTFSMNLSTVNGGDGFVVVANVLQPFQADAAVNIRVRFPSRRQSCCCWPLPRRRCRSDDAFERPSESKLNARTGGFEPPVCVGKGGKQVCVVVSLGEMQPLLESSRSDRAYRSSGRVRRAPRLRAGPLVATVVIVVTL